MKHLTLTMILALGSLISTATNVVAVEEVNQTLNVRESVLLVTVSQPDVTVYWDYDPNINAELQTLPIYGGMTEDGRIAIHKWIYFKPLAAGTYDLYQITIHDSPDTAPQLKHYHYTVGAAPEPESVSRPLTVVKPTATLTELLKPITDGVTNKTDRRRLALYHQDYADLLRRDTKYITTNQAVATANKQALALTFQEAKINAPGIAAQLNEATSYYLGDTFDRTKAIAFFEALAYLFNN